MSFFIHKEPEFERALADLRQQGGISAYAAKRADEIIKSITQKGEQFFFETGKMTNRGESRIKYCRKFDLCKGHRMVFIKKDNHLVLCYIGTHDECFRWIERNKWLKCELDDTSNAIKTVHAPPDEDASLPADVMEERKYVQAYEENILKQIEGKELQKVFSKWFDR